MVSIARQPNATLVAPPRMRWVHGPALDIAMALCWVPFAIAGLVIADKPQHLEWFVGATLLLSFSHQPLTLALVYGDGANFALKRRIFIWSPLVFAVAVFTARNVSLAALAIVAGLWNAEHTLMQRYGICRIYGRKSGQDEGRLEKLLLFSWLVLAMVWAAADRRTPGRIDQTGLGGNNKRGLEILTDFRPAALWILPVVAAIAVGLTVKWVLTEARRGGGANPAKWFYVGTTGALFVTMLINPIAGFLGYVGAHAVEYFIIVHQSIGPRYASRDVDGGAPVGRAIRRMTRPGFILGYLGIIVGLVMVLERYGTPTWYAMVVFTLGGMHVFYDGFIWKLRRPNVATSLGVPAKP